MRLFKQTIIANEDYSDDDTDDENTLELEPENADKDNDPRTLEREISDAMKESEQLSFENQIVLSNHNSDDHNTHTSIVADFSSAGMESGDEDLQYDFGDVDGNRYKDLSIQLGNIYIIFRISIR